MIVRNQTISEFTDGVKYVNCVILAPWDDYYECEFENCSFRNTSLGDTIMPKILRGTFTNCNFATAYISFTEGYFKDCYFGEIRCFHRDILTTSVFENCYVDTLMDICHNYEVTDGLEVRLYRFDKRILHSIFYKEMHRVKELQSKLRKPYEMYSDEHYVWLERCDVKLSVEEQMSLDLESLPRKIKDKSIRHYVGSLRFYGILEYKCVWKWIDDSVLLFLFYKGKKILVLDYPYSTKISLLIKPHADVIINKFSSSNYSVYYRVSCGDITPANELKTAIKISKNYVDEMHNIL